MKRKIRTTMAVTCGVMLCSTLLAPVSAQETSKDCVVPPRLTQSRPDADGPPTQVTIGLLLIDVDSINDAEQSFIADLWVTAGWTDPRLALPSLENCRVPLASIWNGRVLVLNQRTFAPVQERTVVIGPGGSVRIEQRLYGSLASTFDLRDFPFDRQTLRISAASSEYGPEEIEFVVDESTTGRRPDLSVANWSIGEVQLRTSSIFAAAMSRELVRLDFEVEATRRAGYYVWKMVVPLMLIVSMSWTVFWIDPAAVGPRMGISATTILTLIAFQFALGDILPKVSYLTRADVFLLSSVTLGFLALLVSVGSAAMAAKDRPKAAIKLDRWSRGVFPVAFLLAAVNALWW